jgi:hypothetical protein
MNYIFSMGYYQTMGSQQQHLPNNDPNNSLWQNNGYGFNTNFE